MLTLLKWLAGFVVTLVVLIIIAIVVVPQVVDPNDYRDDITALVKEKTGRELRLEGDLSVSVFPWLGVRTQALSLSQPKQIGGDMLSVETAQIRVKLLPLLSKQVEVDTVVLEAPNVRLVTLASGVSSFDGLTGEDSDTTADNGTDVDASAAAVVVQGLALTDGNLTYDNRQESQLYEVKELNLVTGNLIGNDFASIKASGVLVDSENPENTVFSLDGSALIDVDSLIVRAEKFRAQVNQGEYSADVRFAELSFAQNDSELFVQDLTANVNAIQPMNADIDNLRINMESEMATINTLTVASAGAEAIISDLIASKIFDAPNVRGQLNIAPFNAAKLVREFVPDFEPSDSQALKSVALSAGFVGGLDSASVNDLKLNLDDSQLVGSASIKNFEKPKVVFDLNLDQLNLDNYLPESEDESEEESASNAAALAVPMAAFKDVFANGTFKAKQLISGGLELNDVDVVVKSTPGNVSITPRANLYDGSLEGAIAYSETANGAKLKVKNEIDLVSLGKLFNAAEITDQLSGIATLAVDMVVSEANGVQSNEGTIKLLAKNGAIKGIDVKGMIDQGYSKYRQLKGRTDDEEQGTSDENDETKFAELLGTFNLKNNKITNDDFLMKAPLFRIGGEGEIDLESQTLNYLVKVAIVNSSSGQGGEALDKLKGITLPIRLRGNLDSPSFSLDMKALYKFLVKAEVDQKKGEFLQEKLGIEGGEKLSTKDILKQALLKKLNKDKSQENSSGPAPVYDPQGTSDGAEAVNDSAEPPIYNPQGNSDTAPDVQANPNTQNAQEEAPKEDNRSEKDKLKDDLKNKLLEGLFN